MSDLTPAECAVEDAVLEAYEMHLDMGDRCACGFTPSTEYPGGLRWQILFQHASGEVANAAIAAMRANQRINVGYDTDT